MTNGSHLQALQDPLLLTHTPRCALAPLRHAVHILPDIMAAARQAGDVSDTTAFAPLEPKLKLLGDDLTWWTAALAAARNDEQR